EWNFSTGQTKALLSEKRYVVVLAGTRAGKCLQIDTPVLRANGQWSPLRELKTGDEVTSWDESSQGLVSRKITRLYETKRDGVFELQAGEHRIRATREHKFLV